MPPTQNAGELDATLEREIAVPFVPRRGMRLDFADDEDDGPIDVVLGKTVWRVAKNRFEFEMTEVGENGGTVLALMDEWTTVGLGSWIARASKSGTASALGPRKGMSTTGSLAERISVTAKGPTS